MMFQNVLLITNINGNHNQRMLYIDVLIKFNADYIHVLLTCSKYDCKIQICMEMKRGSFQIVHFYPMWKIKPRGYKTLWAFNCS